VRGSLTRRGERSWRFKYDLPGNSKRETRYVTIKDTTKAKAQAEAAKIIASVAGGTHVDPSAETVAEFLERWLRDEAAINVSNASCTKYAQLLRTHVAARVGPLPLQKLTGAHLKQVYAAMAREGLSDRTRLHVHRVVHTMLKHAEQWGVVPRNVAKMIDAPKIEERDEVATLTTEHVQRVLDSLTDKSLRMIALLLLMTGLRRNEALALHWRDVDLDAAKLKVVHAFEHHTKEGLRLKAPKTRRSRRTVTLPSAFVTELRAHKRAQQELRLALGIGGRATLVFDEPDGTPLSPDTITRRWERATKRLGLKATLHSLRHTHASTLILSGLDVITVSRRLGHSSPVLTLNTYGHLIRPDDQAATIMDKALKRME
jgi:integrase